MKAKSRGGQAAALLAALAVAATALPGGLALPQRAAAQESPEALFQEAVGHFRDARYREAMAIFRRIFEKDPNPFVLFNIGRCYEELGELEDAEKYYQRSVGLEGLPREAKVDALNRLERLSSVLKSRAEERRVRTEALMRIDRGVFAARAASDRGAPVEPPAVTSRGPGWGTWLGIGLAAVGAAGLGVGGVFYSDVESGLDRQRELSAIYVTEGNEAVRTMDPNRARAAQASGVEVNALADTIEEDQRWSGIFFTAGTLLLLGGVTLIVVDLVAGDAEEAPTTSLRLGVSPGGVEAQLSF